MSFTGGKLSLKGGEPLPAAGGVKKKKKKRSKDKPQDGGEGGGGEGGSGSAAAAAAAKKGDGFEPAPPPEGADRRTEAQRARDARMAKVEEERLRRFAAKGYRDRVKEFNEHLAGLSEHHDIPKVGPG
jgi:protein FAM32A